jgi:pyrroline-5-carboxylate reductase
MKTKTLGFIGGGRITRILLQAFKNQNVSFNKVVVYDLNPEPSANLQKQFPSIVISDLAQAASQDIVVIALHPPVIMEMLDKIQPSMSGETTLLSLAPKITMGKISQKLGNVNRIVRLIPNATSIINEGYNPVCFSPGIEAADKQSLLQMLEALGRTFEVPESKLEAYAVISAMAPTYFWFQWKKLCDIGQQIGLEKEASEQAVSATMNAAVNTMFNSGLKWSEVSDLIPVKPIGEYEEEIMHMFEQKLVGLYNKISS